jgi:hypothetical protein
MIDRRLQLLLFVIVSSIAAGVVCPPDAAAQANVGSGPMTGTLPETEPTTGAISLGRIRLAPGLTIRELGYDSNVFDEPVDPKSDFVASLQPDASAFTLLRFAKLAGYAGGDFKFFKDYRDERSTGYMLRGRADILLSRLRPFIAGGQQKMRTRPNGEIDIRAERKETELSGGIAFDVSRYGQVYAATNRYTTIFQNSVERGVDLGGSLNRDKHDYSVGVRTELTPLAALTVQGVYSEDTFHTETQRNASARSIDATLRIGAEAVVSGFVTVAVTDFKPIDPLIRSYRGVTGRVGLLYPFLEIGRFNIQAVRGVEYSFDESEGYYVENSVILNYTQFLAGNFDANVSGAWSFFDYGFTARSPARQDKLNSVGGGVGYNLPNRTRISVNYEFARRRSLQLPLRNYDRRRVYLAWTFAL